MKHFVDISNLATQPVEGDPLPAELGAEHPQHVVVVRRHEHVLGARLSARKKIFVKCEKNICYLHHLIVSVSCWITVLELGAHSSMLRSPCSP